MLSSLARAAIGPLRLVYFIRLRAGKHRRQSVVPVTKLRLKPPSQEPASQAGEPSLLLEVELRAYLEQARPHHLRRPQPGRTVPEDYGKDRVVVDQIVNIQHPL
jgi:hypothetical protein